MDAAEIVGFATVVASVAVKVLGEPHQIMRNVSRRSTVGLSPVLYALSFLSYVLWTVHGILINDTYLIVAQSIGVVTSFAVISQMYIYRESKKKGKPDSQRRSIT